MSNPVWNGRCLPCAGPWLAHVAIAVHSKIGWSHFSYDHSLTPQWEVEYPTSTDEDKRRRWKTAQTISSLMGDYGKAEFEPILGAYTESTLFFSSPASMAMAWCTANGYTYRLQEPLTASVAVPSLTESWAQSDHRVINNSLMVRVHYLDPPPANPPYDEGMEDPSDPAYSLYWKSTDEVLKTSRRTVTLTNETSDAVVRGIVDGLVAEIPWASFDAEANVSGYVYWGDDGGTPTIKFQASIHGNVTEDLREDYFLAVGAGQTMRRPANVAGPTGDIYFPTYVGGSLAPTLLGGFPMFFRAEAKLRAPDTWARYRIAKDTILDTPSSPYYHPWQGDIIRSEAAAGSNSYGFVEIGGGSCSDQVADGFECGYEWRTVESPGWSDRYPNLWWMYRFDRECATSPGRALRF
jgi:hypothetical protein